MIQGDPLYPLLSFPSDNILQTVVQYHNKDTDIDTIHRSYSFFLLFTCTYLDVKCVCV